MEEDESDPRSNLHALHDHNPWGEGVPDPEEGDIQEYITRSPDGRTTFVSRTFTTGGPIRGQHDRNGRALDPQASGNVSADFARMMANLMGPQFRQGQVGRSGPEQLFPRAEPEPFPPLGGGLMGGGMNMDGPPQVTGQRFTFTYGRGPGVPQGQQGQPADFTQYATPASPSTASGPSFLVISIRGSPDQLARILGNIFNAMSPLGQVQHPDNERDDARAGLPPGLQGLFATLFNPANAVLGDAVYSEEALDRIMTTLMEQHPTSNAPGPASEEAIAGLPKRNLDEKMLGPELKAECSVCMDDVTVGDEVVVLPCTHWFHEACAKAWLSEHNTCPICRTGIGGPAIPPRTQLHPPPPNMYERALSTGYRPSAAPAPEHRHLQPIFHPDPHTHPMVSARPRRAGINEERLNAIRERGRLSSPSTSTSTTTSTTTSTPNPFPPNPSYHGGNSSYHHSLNRTSEPSGPRRYQVVGSSENRNRTPSPPAMPGSYASRHDARESQGQGSGESPLFGRRRNSEMSENQRESRRNTSGGSDHSNESQGSGSGSRGS